MECNQLGLLQGYGFDECEYVCTWYVVIYDV